MHSRIFIILSLLIHTSSFLADKADDIFYHIHPQWSPDGTKIAFYEWKAKASFSSIMVVDTKTGKLTNYTDSQYFNANPTWHPNGKELLFSSARPNMGGEWQIYRLDLVSKEITQLTFDGLRKGHSFWNPDANSIVYQQKVLTEDNSFKTDLYQFHVNSKKETRLTETEANEFHPKFSSNTNSFVYDGALKSPGRLYQYNLDTHNSQLLLPHFTEEHAGTPAISPNGKFVAFASGSNDAKNRHSNIVLYEFATQSRIVLTSFEDGFNAGAPSWSPDNKKIAFHAGKGRNMRVFIIDLQTKAIQPLLDYKTRLEDL